MTIEFLDQEFATKTAFERWLRDQVAALPLDTKLTGHGLDLAWAILDRRRSRLEKIGAGIESFWLISDYGGGRSFRLRRDDGSTDNFSWRKAVTEGSEFSYVTAALRFAIWTEVQEFRTAAFAAGEVRCGITGVVLSEDECEVDHVLEFWRLRDEWVESVGGPGAVAVSTSTGARAKAVLKDAAQLTSWLAFHRENAELRLTTPDANRERGG